MDNAGYGIYLLAVLIPYNVREIALILKNGNDISDGTVLL